MRMRTNITKDSGIYQLKSKVNGNFYIGSAVNLKKRILNEHLNQLRNNKHYNRYLQNHINKYGIDDLIFGIIEFCTREKLIEREQYYINILKPEFNLRPIANSNLGYKYTEESRNNMSVAQKGHAVSEEQRKNISQTLKGNIPWNKGKIGVLSEESKRKISESLKGRIVWNKGIKLSEEMKLKLSIAHKGQIRTEEQKRKTSESLKKTIKERGGVWNKGYHHTEEAKRKIRTFQKGRKRSAETIRKFSEARKGHVVSMETRMKISETKRQRRIAV